MSWFRRDTAHIGFHLDERAIRIAQVKKVSQRYELVHAEVIPLPEGQSDGDIVQLVKDAVIRAKLPSRVVTAISSSKVLLRPLLLPVMPEAELEEAVKYEAEAYLPGLLGDRVTGFIKTIEHDHQGIKMQELILMAARKESVNNLTSLLREVGLEMVAIDVEPLAIARSAIIAGRDYGGQKGQVDTFALVKIGVSNTLVAVIHNNAVRFVRVIPYGALVTKEMVIELGRSLDYCLGEHRLEVARVYLTGDSYDLGEIIASTLDIEIARFDPLKMIAPGVSLAGENDMAVAVGLALKEVS